MRRGLISFTLVLLMSACASVNDATKADAPLTAAATFDSRNADLNLSALTSSKVMDKIKAQAFDLTVEQIRAMPYGTTILNADGSVKNVPEIKGLRRATNLEPIRKFRCAYLS